MKAWFEPGTAVRDTALAAATGIAGAGLFLALGVPAGALLGALAACGLRSTFGRPLNLPRAARSPLMGGVGLATGLGVTPAVIEQAAAWPLSLALLALATAAMTVIGYAIYRKLSAIDPETAFFSTVPGAFSSIMIIAEDRGSDLDRIVTAHLLRVLLLLSLAPLLVTPGVRTYPESAAGLYHGGLAWMLVIAASFTGYGLAKVLRVPLPAFLGSLAGSAVLSAAGVVSLHPPGWLADVLGAGLGIFIGTRLQLKTLVGARRHLGVSIGVLAIMSLLGAAVGAVAGAMVGVGPQAGILAFAPGSMETMVTIALSLKVNASYVAVHHIARIVGLVAVLPMLDRWLFGRTVAVGHIEAPGLAEGEEIDEMPGPEDERSG